MNIQNLKTESNLNTTSANELRQYLHDLKSPLAALKVALSGKGLTEDKTHIAKTALKRLEEMSLNLNKNKKETPITNINPVKALKEAFDEKRLEFSAKKSISMELSLSPSSFDAICPLEETLFKTIVSNILNNSFEAIQKQGRIKISTRSNEKSFLIQIRDNGIGIAPELFGQLTKLGATYGKNKGSGLGLHHAKKTLNSWGGELHIQSIMGEQTLVTISLPLIKKARPTLSLVS